MRLSIRHPRVYATQKIVTGFGVYFICEGKSTIAALENETWEFVFFFSKKKKNPTGYYIESTHQKDCVRKLCGSPRTSPPARVAPGL